MHERNWRLSNALRLSPQEVTHLLTPSELSSKEKAELQGRYFWLSNVTMGMDPEFFLADKDLRPIPAFQVLPSKTQNPYLFWDGFQAECTVRPRTCHQELAQELARSLKRVQHKILPTPIWRVPPQLLQTAELDHVRLGCDPSYNVYNMKGQHVEDGRQLPFRFAGGHVHFSMLPGWKTPSRVKSCIKALDALCAVACVCFAQGVDMAIRRKYYGLPGEFRLPEHGVEWRTLSNFWMYDPLSYHLVFDLARWAFGIGMGGLRCYMGHPDLVVNIVQFGDVKAARDLVKLNAPLYQEFLKYYPAPAQAKFWQSIEQGFLKTIPDYGRDINGAWRKVSSEYSQPMWRHIK